MLAVAIVQELEETGYLTTPLDEIAKAMGATRAEAERALAQVQELDPPGVAARDLAECLALQAKAADRYDPAMARLIANLDLLAKGQMAALKRICGVDDEDLADMVRELRAYDPKPGCRFAEAPSESVVPDVLVRRLRGGWAVELNTAALAQADRQPPLLCRAEERAAEQGVEGVAQRMPRQRRLAGQGARPARADDRQGGERDRRAAGRLLPRRRAQHEAADVARGGGGGRGP